MRQKFKENTHIPNVSEESLRNWWVRYCLWKWRENLWYFSCKVTPKSETSSSPEEKLLRSIFGEKAQMQRLISKLHSEVQVLWLMLGYLIIRYDSDERSIAIERAELVQSNKKSRRGNPKQKY